MAPPPPRHHVDGVDHPDRLREVIPGYTRSGLLRRVDLPDGGIEFIESRTDRVFARYDGRGRLVARPRPVRFGAEAVRPGVPRRRAGVP
jgi:hypothetical protein